MVGGSIRIHGTHAMTAGERLARAVLLFHSGKLWTQENQTEWKKLTGIPDAKTRRLGTLARRVLRQEGQPPHYDREPTGLYLILSTERCGWWMHGARGYTFSLSAAGRFPRDEAIRICTRAAYDACREGHVTDVPVAEADAHAIWRQFRRAHPDIPKQVWE